MAGIYIHIPFCRQACHYCNFHFSTSLAKKEEMLTAITREIQLTKKFEVNQLIETIYFGGGTPSLLTKDELNGILEAITSRFIIANNAEITLEANPDDITESILQDWLKSGINRLSLGVQSFDEAELKWMNRAHDASQSLGSIEKIQAACFGNFSVDLIYGSPMLSNEAFEKNVKIIIDKNIPHISAYALTVEDKTALHHHIKTQQSAPVDEIRQAEQFELLLDLTAEAGYEQYEISNFAKHGFRSKHNSSYWKGKAYYGFGPSAHSYDGVHKRRWNISNNALYIKSLQQQLIPFEEEVLTVIQQLNEMIMISLRTVEGIDLSSFEARFGRDHKNELESKSQSFILEGLLKKENEFLFLTKKGKFLADGMAAELFF